MSPALDTVLRAARAVIGGRERPAAIGVRDGTIAVVGPPDAALAAREEIRVGDDAVVLPGLVDTHVHLQDPGATRWEGFPSGTRAAAAGGVTTLLDMPLDSQPATVDLPSLRAKRAAAAGRCHVDVGFWAGVTPQNLGALRDLHRAGVFGFKCFLVDTGLADLPPVTVDQLRAALAQTAAFGGFVAVHAEDPAGLAALPRGATPVYRDFLGGYPVAVETVAVAAVIEATRATGGRSHLVHLSGAQSAWLVAAARREGLPVSAETCPHYLTLTAEQVPDGDTSFKACPPIRDEGNADLLWRCLGTGGLEMVVSDHSPCGPGHKGPDFTGALGGIASLQLSLPVMWTAARARGTPLARLVDWMAARPAALAGLRRKGRIAQGYDADLCVLAPDESFVVDPRALHHRVPLTPYAGRTLTGVVRETWLRGQRIDPARPRGRLLSRT
ncbi:MAG: allantoinase [Micromonosporaceae bacterium]